MAPPPTLAVTSEQIIAFSNAYQADPLGAAVDQVNGQPIASLEAWRGGQIIDRLIVGTTKEQAEAALAVVCAPASDEAEEGQP